MLLISSVSCITQQVFLQPEYEKNKFRHFMIIKIQHEKLSTALCAGKLHIFHWFSYSWNDWFRSYYSLYALTISPMACMVKLKLIIKHITRCTVSPILSYNRPALIDSPITVWKLFAAYPIFNLIRFSYFYVLFPKQVFFTFLYLLLTKRQFTNRWILCFNTFK